MEDEDNRFQMKRTFSNSPLYQRFYPNKNTLINELQQSQSSENYDSILSSNNNQQEEFNTYDTYNDFINSQIINTLLLKAEKDKNRIIRMKNSNSTLKEQVNFLKKEIKRKNFMFQKNKKNNLKNKHFLNPKEIDSDFDLDNRFYTGRNINRDQRASSMKMQKIMFGNNNEKNRMNNYDNYDNFEDVSNYINNNKNLLEVNNYKKKINSLQLMVKGLQNELTQKKRIIIKLNTDNNALIKQNKNLKQKIYELMTISSLKNNNNNININNYKIKNSNNDKDNIIEEMKKELKSKNEKINELQKIIDNLNKEKKELSHKFEVLQKKKSKENPRTDSLISDGEDGEDDKVNEGQNKLYYNYKKKSDLLAQKEKEYSLLLDNFKKIEKEKKDIETELLKSNNIVSQKELLIKELNKDKEENLKKQNEITKKYNELKENNEKIVKNNNTNNDLLKTKNNQLEQVLKDKENIINNLNEKISTLSQEITNKNLELTNLEKNKNDLEKNMKEEIKKVNDYKKDNENNLENISKLKKEINEQKKENSDKTEEIKKLSIELKAKIETINKINENCDHNKNDYTDMINKYNKEILELKQKVESLNEEISNKDTDLKNKENEYKNKLEEIKKLNDLSENLKNQNYELLLSNEELNGQIKTITSEKEKEVSKNVLIQKKLDNQIEENKKLKEEDEEKNLQISDLAKKINDNEIQINHLKSENEEKNKSKKQILNEIKQKENKIISLNSQITNLESENNKLNKEVSEIKNENKKLNDKMFLFEEEKIKLITNLNDKESEYNTNKKKVADLSQQLEDFKSILNQKMEEDEKLKETVSKLESDLNLAKLELEQKGENLKQMEEKYNILKNETLNNRNLMDKSNKKNSENNNELITIIEQNNQLFKDKANLEKELTILKDNIIKLEKEIIKSKNENDNLQNKIKQLSEENLNINESNNQINNKYHELKKKLSEKDKEIQNSKEIYTALIEKQKTQVEQENKVDPNSYKIITNKTYKKLIWYLIIKKNKSTEIIDENNYNNYRWVTGLIIKKDQIDKFNQFETDEEKINNYKEIISDFHKKLEKKEESISKLEFKNKKLNEQLHNKTANPKGMLMKNNIMGSASKNTTINNNLKNNNSEINENRICQLQTENSKLKEEIKAKDQLMLGVKDINNIELQDDNSGFLDDDFKENKNGNEVMLDFIKSKNDIFDDMNSKKSGAPGMSQVSSSIENKINEKKVDDFLNKGIIEDNDLDVEKHLQEQIKFFKKEIKEKDIKLNSLTEQVKELLKNIKCDIKNKPHVVQICQLLGIPQQIMNKIVTNKKNIIF